MSAFIVSETHIRYLVNAALTFGRRYGLHWYSRGTAGSQPARLGELANREPYDDLERERNRVAKIRSPREVGQMLWDENRRSVDSRYDEENEAALYRHQPIASVDPIVALKLIACYEYQACEHDGWPDSEARAFCDALQLKCIAALPGYDDAPWSIGDDEPTPPPAPAKPDPEAERKKRGEGEKYDGKASLADIKRGVIRDIALAVAKGELPKADYKVSARRQRNSRPNVDVSIDGLPFAVMHADKRRVMVENGGRDHSYHGPSYSPEAMKVRDAVEAIVKAYGYDRSDSQTDYFDVAFYSNVELAQHGREWDEARIAGEVEATPCYSSMRCLCAGHARGDSPDAACNTSEEA